ncbi:hypothetical protein [Paenibacillus sp. Soil522]|uniref:hypothetical protein n=1 Tax=Paenibacillus sp. Soil522 TaxID=1736388 RepID=UPI000A9543FE
MDLFEREHAVFIEKHLVGRNGERKDRLLRGHGYGEKLLLQNVWWPVFGNFDYLHPEYEVYDRNRKSYFLDLAFTPPFGLFNIECHGFQSHIKDMDREKFSYSLNRDTFLTALGWKNIHFSFDDIKDRPEICRSLLQLVIGPYLLNKDSAGPALKIERISCFLLGNSAGLFVRRMFATNGVSIFVHPASFSFPCPKRAG